MDITMTGYSDPQKDKTNVSLVLEKDKLDDKMFNELNAHPLNNSLILEKIFGFFVNPDDLKACRLVSKVWEEEATPFLGKLTYLSINSIGFPIFAFLGESDLVKPYLSRRIKVFYDSSTIAAESHFADYINHISSIIFLAKYREEIQEILFHVDVHFANIMKAVLNNYKFPKLRKITIHKIYNKDSNSPPIGPKTIKFPVMPSIKVLELCASTVGIPDPNSPYHPIFQELINKSPNLERIKVVENWNPDLSSCSKLKFLESDRFPWTALPFNATEHPRYMREDFVISPESRSLMHQVNTLEEVVLGFWIADEEGRTILDYRHVHMAIRRIMPLSDVLNQHGVQFTTLCSPKLVRLVMDPFPMSMFRLACLSQRGLPSLKILKMTEKGGVCGRYLDLMMDCYTINPVKFCWNTVEQLELAVFPFSDENATPRLKSIAKIFPNLKTFVIGLTAGRGPSLTEDDYEALAALFKMMASVGGWSLQNLVVHIKFRLKVTKLMEAIFEAGFKDGINLKFVTACQNLAPDDGEVTDFDGASLNGISKICFDGFLLQEDMKATLENLMIPDEIIFLN